MRTTIIHKIIQLISLFFFGLAVWLITQEIEHIGLHHIIQMIISVPIWVIAIACIFTLLDFFVLTEYDLTALNYIQKKLPFKTVFKTASIGFAVSNTVGHSFVSGGAIRYLFYTPHGIRHNQILILIAFETLTLFMGMGFVYVVATGLLPFTSTLHNMNHIITFYIASFIILCVFFLYFFLIVWDKRTIKINNVVLKAPDIKMTLRQLIIGLTDNFLVSLTFYSILRYYIDTPFLPVFIIFSIAQITGQFSQVPGGLGVLASMFILLFPHTAVQKSSILAALFIFRFVYFFIPLPLAGIFLAKDWIFHQLKNSKNLINKQS